MPGKVYLIGMGPGDPELITVKAIKAMKKCDVLVYDRLVNKALLRYNQKAQLVYVGKTTGEHTKTQDEINSIIVELAEQGHIVGRLKGGDPFVFGRGGEEALYLKDRGIAYEIIAGMTSAVAVPQYAGIPVTFRGLATSFHVITGHESGVDSNINWEALANVNGTLIFLMGVENLDMITQNLINHGKTAQCPAAVIMNGTRENQREVYGTLEDIKQQCEINHIKSPAIILIGEVVQLHEDINWKARLPLYGLKVVSTRPEDKAEELMDGLKALGARVFNLPCIHISGIKPLVIDEKQVVEAEHIVFSSTYGVKYFIEALKDNGIDIRKIKAGLFGVGPSVKKELEGYGLLDCQIPDSHHSDSLIAMIKEKAKPGEKLLIVSGNLGSERLLSQTSEYKTTQLVVYRTEEDCKESLSEDIDVLTFTSPSCVRGFVKAHGMAAYGEKLAVCIGESTLAQAIEAGFTHAKQASNPSTDAMCQLLIEWRSTHA